MHERFPLNIQHKQGLTSLQSTNGKSPVAYYKGFCRYRAPLSSKPPFRIIARSLRLASEVREVISDIINPGVYRATRKSMMSFQVVHMTPQDQIVNILRLPNPKGASHLGSHIATPKLRYQWCWLHRRTVAVVPETQ
ncbi:hypothetical protein PM082_006277 [Marasmius tenuissimus]|nr:hypothetical protein PM082_006277 [Marasmius tenuissimus]